MVTLAGDALRERTGASWVHAYGMDALVASSADDYVARATKLARDEAWRADLTAEVAVAARAAHPPHCDTAGFGARFSDALAGIAERSGRFCEFGKTHVPPQPPGDGRPTMPSDIAPPPKGPPFVARRGAAMVRVAILASPRTGSTILCDRLNQLDGAVCHYELFHADMIQYVDRVADDQAALAERDADPVAFLRKVIGRADHEGYRLAGFKHFDHLSGDVTRHVISDPLMKIIHLTRGNLLAQFSSEAIAKASAQWFEADGAAQMSHQIAFDQAAFEAFEAHEHNVVARRMALLAASGRAPLCLDYEGLTLPQTAARLEAFLGLPLAPAAPFHFKRQNPPSVLARFSDPQAVAAYLEQRGRSGWANAS